MYLAVVGPPVPETLSNPTYVALTVYENQQTYPLSNHGVKVETYDAVLIYVKSKTGKTLTPKFLMEGDLEDELMRTSEDTKRIVLDNSVSVEEITEIEVGGSNSNYYSNDYEDEEFIEGDDYF